jgi:hypothetical protein
MVQGVDGVLFPKAKRPASVQRQRKSDESGPQGSEAAKGKVPGLVIDRDLGGGEKPCSRSERASDDWRQLYVPDARRDLQMRSDVMGVQDPVGIPILHDPLVAEIA